MHLISNGESPSGHRKKSIGKIKSSVSEQTRVMSEQAGMRGVATVCREIRLGYSPINGWESLRQGRYAYRLLSSNAFI